MRAALQTRRLTPLEHVSLGDAMRRFFAKAKIQVPSAEAIAIDAARSRVLADDLVSRFPVPSRPLALHEGYALRVSDLDSTRSLQEVDLRDGHHRMRPLGRHDAARVRAGEELPPGGDAVASFQRVRRVRGELVLTGTVSSGDGTAAIGSDIEPGTVVLPRGRVLQSRDLSLLSALGREFVNVYRRPNVAVIATRDAFAGHASETTSSNVRRLAVGAILAAWGATVFPLPEATSDPETVAAAMEMVLPHCDALVLTADLPNATGADRVAHAVAALSPRATILDGLRLHPCEAVTMALLDGRPILGVAGDYGATVLGLAAVLEPIIRALTGRAEAPPHRICIANQPLWGEPRCDTLIPVLVRGAACTPVAMRPGSVLPLAAADGYVRVAASGVIPAGAEVIVEPLP